MLFTSKMSLEIYKATIELIVGDYAIDVKLMKVEKGEILAVDNPHYKLQEKFDQRSRRTTDC